MSDKPAILLQLDSDPQASVFDSVVAVDAGVQHLLLHPGVLPEQVRTLVHGAMFTRGGDDLKRTAVFIGGSDVAAAETILDEVKSSFFGPMRVSVMFDANGANTTAAAAVLAAAKHGPLTGVTTLVLGGTGPVGQRVARLLARQGAVVRIGSRTVERALDACANVAASMLGAELTPFATGSVKEVAEAMNSVEVVVAAGAAGAELLPAESRRNCRSLRVAIDLNAVPPAGIAGVDVTDKGRDRGWAVCYGAIGVGGAKMKIHKAALQRLFESNDLVLDAEEIYEIGRALSG